MNGASHQLLARARLAADEHGGGGGGHAHDQLGQLLHLGILAEDEVALGLRLDLAQHHPVPVFQLLRALALREQVPHELGARPAHHLGGGRFERLDGPLDVGTPRDVDDEIHRRVRHEGAELRGHGNIESPRQLETGGPRIEIGDPEDGDGGIAHEHLEEGAPSLAGPDDDDLGHGRRRGPIRTAAAPGRVLRGSRRTRTRG